MIDRAQNFWQSAIVWAAPLLPYVGIFLMMLAGIVLIVAAAALLYLLWLTLKRLPLVLRKWQWRAGASIRLARTPLTRKQAVTSMMRFAGTSAAVELRRAFVNGRRWPWRRWRPDEPLLLVWGEPCAEKVVVLGAITDGGLSLQYELQQGRMQSVWWRGRGLGALEIPRDPQEDPAALDALVEGLKVLQPERPVDAQVAVISAQSLMDDRPGGVSEVSRIFTAMREAAQRLELIIPLTLVITGLERLRGFREFVSAVGEDQVVRVLSCHVLPAASGTSVEAQFEGWHSSLRRTLLARLIEDDLHQGSDGHLEAMAFLAEFSRLSEVLCGWAQPLQRHDPDTTGAVWLTKVVAAGTTADEPSGRLLPVFEWVRDASFAAAAVSAPASRRLRRRIRHRRIAWSLLAASVLIAGVATPLAVTALRRDAEAAMATIKHSHRDITMAQAHAGGVVHYDASRLHRLLSAVHATAQLSNWAIGAPHSWFASARGRLLVLLGDALRELVVHPRVQAFAQDAPRASGVDLMAEPSRPADRAEELPAFQALHRFLGGRDLIARSVHAAESLTGGITYRDLVAFLREDPKQFVDPPWGWDDNLPRAVARRLETSTNALAADPAEMKGVIAAYWDRLLEEAFDLHIVPVLARDIDDRMRRIAQGQEPSAREVVEIAGLLRGLVGESGKPNASRLLGKQADSLRFFAGALKALGTSRVVPMEQAADASTALIQRREQVRRSLASLEIAGVGPLFTLDSPEGPLVLTAEMKRFVAAWDGLRNQSFVRLAQIDLPELPTGQEVAWDLSKIGQVKDVTAAYKEFAVSGAASFGAILRSAMQRTVQTLSRKALEVALRAAAQPAVVVLEDRSRSHADLLGNLRGQAGALANVARTYRQAITSPEGTDLQVPQFEELLGREILRVLMRMDAQLKSDNVYEGILTDTRRWIETAPPGMALASVMRGGPRERLALARDYVRIQYAAHVTALLDATAGMSPAMQRDPVVQYWRRMLDTLDAFDKGATANSLHELEQYVLALGRWSSPEECGKFVAERQQTSWRADYFSAQLASLEQPVGEACGRRTAALQRKAYDDFAIWFNAHAAGHAPFGNRLTGEPLSRRAFAAVLARYQEMRRQLPLMLNDWPLAMQQFTARLEGMVQRFGAERTKPGVAPGAETLDAFVRARLELRGPRREAALSDQIIDLAVQSGTRTYGLRGPDIFEWKVGEPLEVRLRWAADSEYVPERASDAYSVSGRTVVFRFTSDWAFLELIRQYAIRGDGYDHTVLRFPITVVGPHGRQTAQVVMTLQSTDEKPLSLDAPDHAPLFQASAAMQQFSSRLAVSQ